jgi:hypothetical protein
MTLRSVRLLAFPIGVACVVACLLAVPHAQSGFKSASYDPPGLYHDQRAEDLFTQARIAISGAPGGVSRLQGLRFKGHSKVLASDGQTLDGVVEIRIQLPDKYLRIDSGTFGRRLTGYAGTTPLTLVEDSDKRVVAEPKDVETLTAARFDLARFMLGAATWVSREVQVTLYTRDTPVNVVGPADPLGVDAVSADGAGFAARVIMDAKSRMPARVVYRAGEPRTITIVERKASGGYKLPSHIVTTTAGAGDRVVDEMTFDEITINPKFAKTDFAK